MISLSRLRLTAFLATSLLCVGAPTFGQDRSLKDAAQGRFLIGVAINEKVFLGKNATEVGIVTSHFNSVSPENCLKWETVHPEPGRYDFSAADRYVAFGVEHRLFIIGHTLMWHYQTPDWVFKNPDGTPKNKAQLLEELRSHIQTVVGRYKGRIRGWDVVNEAIDDEGRLRTDKPWYRILGEEGVIEAFRAAHEADPAAELYYNEFSLWLPAKRPAVLQLVARVRAAGIPVAAVGLQEHYMMAGPSPEEVGETIDAFAREHLPVMITELDVSVLPRPENYAGADLAALQARKAELDPYPVALPETVERALAERYAALFAVYRNHASAIKRITFWGVSDADTWLNNWPIPGRHDYPLLFDRGDHAKPALPAILDALARP